MQADSKSKAKPCCSDQTPEGSHGATSPAGVYTPAVDELVAIGAAIASNCERCFKYHYAQARKLGVTHPDIAQAVATGQRVKTSPANAILELARRHLRGTEIPVPAGAGPDACANPDLNEPDEAGPGCGCTRR